MTTNSRDTILANIRAALGDRRHLPVVHPPGHPPAPADASPLMDHGPRTTDHVSRFTSELESLSGRFLALPADEVEEWLVAFLRQRGAGGVLSWDQDHLPVPGLLDSLQRAQIDVTTDPVPNDAPSRAAALEQWSRLKVGLTGADAALAATGTLILRSGPGRPRLASLSTETHIALVTADQFHASWEDWIAAAGPGASDWVAQASNVSLVSGPSRTADIEMTLTVGVHGPGEVLVVLVTEPAQP